ncbi:hypothetical protein RI129_011499 [Pyrocoelia pectoralis]|uniref:RUN domain-containing protein n=1 Tax=Pyrocoelia pectoralis TaxID=417401 RepID=A0AAN7ZD67_9COLE
MKALMKSVNATNRKKQTLIKDSIITQLSNSVKEIQLYHMGDTISSDSLQMSEAESALCAVIEAMFLHGLKDSLVHQARRVIADLEERPEPSFWAPLLIISHKQNINQIANLSQITTEIGQCRAWIRIALNECLLSSYLSTMRQDSSVLKPYYNTYALIRDNELLDVAQRLIEGVEAFTEFTLPCNTSLLNTWQLQSLVLAGIWSPTLRSCPIAAGVDVAQSLQSTSAINSETDSLSSAFSFNSHSSGLGGLLSLNEDEALKIILAKHSSEQSYMPSTFKPLQDNKKASATDLSETGSTSAESENTNFPVESNLGNSLNRRSGWSFSEIPDKSEGSDQEIQSPNLARANSNTEIPKSMETSYNDLIESYNLLGSSHVKTPDFKEVWQSFEDKRLNKVQNTIQMDETAVEVCESLESSQEKSMLNCILNISRERGLDFQNYQCAECKESLSLMPKPKTCGFTAKYFCDICMSEQLVCLPARVIHNWDFKVYEVSQNALSYITEMTNHPTIDLKLINPFIYTVSAEMAKLQNIRIQLNFLRDYLYTCREPVIEELQKQIGGKDYMYEHVHQYSIADLSEIQNGALSQHLQKVVQFGIDHVHNCWLCSQKGFICEVCKKSKVLYPFEIENVYRCNVCNAIYHNGCLNSNQPCRKCDRKKKREDLPLLGATIE